MTMTNEEAARMTKATRLVGVARLGGITADALGALDEAGWVALAKLAGVRYPSTETRTVAVSCMRGIEAAAPKTLLDDPFAGLPH